MTGQIIDTGIDLYLDCARPVPSGFDPALLNERPSWSVR